MAFYNFPKQERVLIAQNMYEKLLWDIEKQSTKNTILFFANEDTYMRKTAYLAIGKIFLTHKNLQQPIIEKLHSLHKNSNEKIRQTVINAAGEIGKTNFEMVAKFFDSGLFDEHHIGRNAVIGSIKKMVEKNPTPVLAWARQYLQHEDKEIRHEICHGIELRGRTHPQDILPLLKTLQWDNTARVKNTLIHVLGQIAYKEGCLQIVIAHLNRWENKELVQKAIDEIIDVHERYKNFSALTRQQAINFIKLNLQK